MEHSLWLRTGLWREISNITVFYILGGNKSCEELRLFVGFPLTSTGSGYQITFSVSAGDVLRSKALGFIANGEAQNNRYQ